MGAVGVKRYGGVPMEERKAARREALIRSAIHVYGERGYRNATVKSVCDVAGLTERYFYESFPHSEALLIASFEAVNRIVLACVERAAEACNGAPMQKASAILNAYFNTLKDRPKAARVFLVEIGGVSRSVDLVLDRAMADFGALIERTLCLDLAAPAAHRRQLLRAGVGGGILHIALRWIADGYAHDVGEVTSAGLRLIETLTVDRL